MLLKTRGPEATLSEAASSEAAEATLPKAASSEVISPEAEDQLDLQKIEESTLQKLSIGFKNIAENQWNIATVISKVFEGMCLQFGRKR